MSILGNPITLGGGGADLNIDFGSAPPTDTSKLWVPLASKPKSVKVDFRSEIGSITQEHHPVTAPIMTEGMALCDVGDYIYVFGGKLSTYQWVSNNVYKIDKATYTQENITSQIPLPAMPAGMAPCVYYNNCIYIIGGHASYTSSCFMRNQQIMKVDLSTNTATVVYQQPTSSSNVEPWMYVDAFLFEDKIVIAGGSTAANEVGFNYHSSDFVRIFDPATNNIERYRCPAQNVQAMYHTKNKVIFSASSTELYEFDLSTKQFVASTSTSGNIYSKTPYGRWRIGDDSYSIWSLALTSLRQWHQDTHSETIAATLSSPPNTQLGSTSRNNYIAWFANAGVLYTKFNFELESGALLVNTDYTDDVWEAVKGKNTSLYACPLAVYLGDENGTAQEQTAYLYDTSDGKWKTLDGVSYTADMLNALNIMGVT